MSVAAVGGEATSPCASARKGSSPQSSRRPSRVGTSPRGIVGLPTGSRPDTALTVTGSSPVDNDQITRPGEDRGMGQGYRAGQLYLDALPRAGRHGYRARSVRINEVRAGRDRIRHLQVLATAVGDLERDSARLEDALVGNRGQRAHRSGERANRIPSPARDHVLAHGCRRAGGWRCGGRQRSSSPRRHGRTRRRPCRAGCCRHPWSRA